MSQKQENTSKNTQSGQNPSYPENWKKEGNVVVKQERLLDLYGNGEMVAVPHSHPVQVYPQDTFDALNIIPFGAKQNGFADQGLKVTVLYGDGKSDEDIQLATNPPAASTVIPETLDAAKQAVKMVEEGTDLTPAEQFKEESDKKAQEEGTLVPDEADALKKAATEKPAEKKADAKK